ncbi:MAG: prepilin peptidase [Planctomycetaceae bacterium]|jgi:leader peptidase (prepilin peptidase)/N-methyltransferase|nr:prepilin peptidase [Planctomycetaceae bacterium]
METLLIIWLGALGATVGSFLNVVVYRLPRGESIASPPSHCPKCNHKIRPYDNLPIVGWFLLGGKCRDCKLPISFRYPLVETLACIIVAAFTAALFPTNIAIVRPTYDASANCFTFATMEFYEVLIRIFWLSTFHLFLLTLGLMELDKQTLSTKWIVVFLIPFLILGLFCPFLFPIPFFSLFPFVNFRNAFDSVSAIKNPLLFFHPLYIFWGILSGWILERILAFFTNKKNGMFGCCMIAAGLFLGWQTALTILVGALLLNGVVIFVARQSYAILSLTAVSFFANVAMLLTK